MKTRRDFLQTGLLLGATLPLAGGLEKLATAQSAGGTSSADTLPCDDPKLLFAPYAWKRTGSGPSARAEATMPGAYFKAAWQGSSFIGVRIDGTANNGCPPNSMPVISYSVDYGPPRHVQPDKMGEVYDLPIASGLDRTRPHHLVFHFRASDLQRDRWRASTAHLRVAGITLDAGGTLLSCPSRPRRAVAFGDSITEGVGAEGLFTSWNSIGVNNSCVTWFPVLCSALDCEYGQLGTGGLGVTNAKLEIPPLLQFWDHYDAASSRLTNGLLQPEPDYVFCELGTNDPGLDITSDYLRWLIAARKACRTARFFCIMPPLGVHMAEIQAAVAARNDTGDRHVHLIDTTSLRQAFRAGQGPTELAYDGVHPSIFGHSMLACHIAVEVEKILRGENRR